MGLVGVAVGSFAVVLSVCLYFKSKGHTDKRFNSIEGLTKNTNRKVRQVDKAVRRTHKKKDK